MDWIPKRGALILRIMTTGGRLPTVLLAYRDLENDERHFKSIAKFNQACVAEPYFSAYVDTMRGQDYTGGFGDVGLSRGYAEDEGIIGILRHWENPNVTLREWVGEVNRLSDLLPEERERISRLIEQIGT